jgi:hypothetical protein
MAGSARKRKTLGTYRWEKKGDCFVKRGKTGRFLPYKQVEPTCEQGYTVPGQKEQQVGSADELQPKRENKASISGAATIVGDDQVAAAGFEWADGCLHL